MMDKRASRIAENEALFREINERIAALDDNIGMVSEPLSIVCECGRASCTERIQIRPEDYAELRADPTQFAVIKGHEVADVEGVVAEREGYDVVRKRPGAPGTIAQATES